MEPIFSIFCTLFSHVVVLCIPRENEISDPYNGTINWGSFDHFLASTLSNFWLLWTFDRSKIFRTNWVHNDSKGIPDSPEAIYEFVATKPPP